MVQVADLEEQLTDSKQSHPIIPIIPPSAQKCQLNDGEDEYAANDSHSQVPQPPRTAQADWSEDNRIRSEWHACYRRVETLEYFILENGHMLPSVERTPQSQFKYWKEDPPMQYQWRQLREGKLEPSNDSVSHLSWDKNPDEMYLDGGNENSAAKGGDEDGHRTRGTMERTYSETESESSLEDAFDGLEGQGERAGDKTVKDTCTVSKLEQRGTGREDAVSLTPVKRQRSTSSTFDSSNFEACSPCRRKVIRDILDHVTNHEYDEPTPQLTLP
ncbi:hypothetical protein EWM64_g2770 [Hericium alpestre]|uniref:Uncharacterized protein n=1 Tax=Hericium alpestre TaxID=135208 RepID=A0A4Z0A454_9AGAM|nr:hypothetical protein EWM64_g2770 [Hericium alpestre]